MSAHQPDPNWTEPVAKAESFEDARANLEHTLQVFGPAWDDDMLVTATSNVYGPGIKTGLSVRDLRIIARQIGEADR